MGVDVRILTLCQAFKHRGAFADLWDAVGPSLRGRGQLLGPGGERHFTQSDWLHGPLGNGLLFNH